MLNSPLGGRRGIGFGLGRSWQRESADWWLAGGIPAANCIAAYQPKGAASYAASKVNLANPGMYDATEGVAPAWDAVNGWDFSNGNTYLKTGVIPDGGNYSIIVRYSDTNIDDSGRLVGAENSSAPRFFLIPYYIDKVIYANGPTVAFSPQLTSGVLAIAGSSGYRDGVYDGNIGVWTGTLSYDIWIGGSNRIGILSYPIATGYIKAISIYNTPITSAQVAAVSSEVLTI